MEYILKGLNYFKSFNLNIFTTFRFIALSSSLKTHILLIFRGKHETFPVRGNLIPEIVVFVKVKRFIRIV